MWEGKGGGRGMKCRRMVQGGECDPPASDENPTLAGQPTARRTKDQTTDINHRVERTMSGQ